MTDLNQSMERLKPLPPRIARWPVSPEGFPVPWFVHWGDDGKPDFRVIGRGKMSEALRKKVCWLCGGPLGSYLAFVIGSMCAINRTISEPPSHLECAEFAARACPFMTKPAMRRNEKDLPEERIAAAGCGLKRNPGVVCVWVCRDYKIMKLPDGILFYIGEPSTVKWFAEGRRATRAEVDASIESGLPSLLDSATSESPEAVRELDRFIARVQPLLPRRETTQ